MKIAFIGLGEMGRRLCARLIRAGHTVTVYNRDQKKTESLAAIGAKVATSVVDACVGAEIAISMLRDDEASKEIWSIDTLTKISELAGGISIVEMSTLSKDWTLTLAQTVKSVELNFIAAPVIGSLLPAENGNLIVLAAGDRSREAIVRSVLRNFGEQIFWYDKVETSAIIKLAVNFYFSVQVKGIVDALKVVVAQDSEFKELAFEVFKSIPIVSAPIAGILGMIEQNHFLPSFPIDLVCKDLKYFEQLTKSKENVGNVAKTFSLAQEAGLGKENIHSIWKV